MRRGGWAKVCKGPRSLTTAPPIRRLFIRLVGNSACLASVRAAVGAEAALGFALALCPYPPCNSVLCFALAAILGQPKHWFPCRGSP